MTTETALFVINLDGKFDRVRELPEDFDTLEVDAYYILDEDDPENSIFRLIEDYDGESDLSPGEFFVGPCGEEVFCSETPCVSVSEEDVELLSVVNKVSRENLEERKQKRIIARTSEPDNRPQDAKMLSYVIHEDDDHLVKLLKEQANESGLTLQDLYDRVGDQGKGYNLYYGLGSRRTITFEKFRHWLQILGKEYKIEITDKEK